MNVTLKSFCEDVPLTDPKNVRRYLVFDLNGNEFRVPVGAEAIQAIARHIYGKPAQEVAPEEQEPQKEYGREVQPEPEEGDPEETEATVFGDEEDEPDPDELPPDDGEDPIGALELRRVNEEDGVPSL